jgi:hypothetical protein
MNTLETNYPFDHILIEKSIKNAINNGNINILIQTPLINENSFLYSLGMNLFPNIILYSPLFIHHINRIIVNYKLAELIQPNDLKIEFEYKNFISKNIIIFDIKELTKIIMIKSLLKTEDIIFMIHFNNCYSLITINSNNNSLCPKDFNNRIFNEIQNNFINIIYNAYEFHDIDNFQLANNKVTGNFIKKMIYHHIGKKNSPGLNIKYAETINNGKCLINAIVMHLQPALLPGSIEFNNCVNTLISDSEQYIHNNGNTTYKFDGGPLNMNPDIVEIVKAIVNIISKNIVIIYDHETLRNNGIPFSCGQEIEIINFHELKNKLLKFEDTIYILGYSQHFTLLKFESNNNTKIFKCLYLKTLNKHFRPYTTI